MSFRPTSLSDFNDAELLLSNMRIGQDIVRVQIPVALTQRTFWGLHVPVNTSADWYFEAVLRLYSGGANVAEFPFSGGASTASPTVMPRSMISALVPNGGTTPVAHSIFVAIKDPMAAAGTFAGEAAFYYLSPFDIEIAAELATLSITGFSNVSAVRMILAVQSTQKL